MSLPDSTKKDRIVFLDWLRVCACMMVILIHCAEPFYLGYTGTDIETRGAGLLATILDSMLRAAVPLFVMTSSYLLFPVRDNLGQFFKRRATRVLLPLAFWVVAYTLYGIATGGGFGELTLESACRQFGHLILNFPDAGSPLWFVYMLVGIYVAMPVFSPFIDKLTKKEERVFLGIWLFTTLVPFFRLISVNVFGRAEFWGECNWNEFGTLYYISGFIGYVVLAHYFKKHVGELTWKQTLSVALPLWAIGYGITAGWFWAAMPKDFPVHQDISVAVYMETSWGFCSFGVALTTIAYFMLFRKIKSDGTVYRKLVLPLSKISYGIYLVHLMVLLTFFPIVSAWNLGGIATLFITGIFTFCTSAIIIKAISLALPSKLHKFIIG